MIKNFIGKLIWYCIPLILLLPDVNAQGTAKADSLSNILSKNPQDSIAFVKLYKQAVNILYSNPTGFLPYGELLLISSKAQKKQTYIQKSLNLMAVHYLYTHQYDKAISYQQKTLEAAKALGDSVAIAIALNNIGTTHKNTTNNLVYATDYFLKSIAFLENYSKKDTISLGMLSSLYANLGGTYVDLQEDSTALSYFQKSLDVTSDSTQHDGSYHNMGIIYLNNGETEKALTHFFKSLELSQRRGDSTLTGQNYFQIGAAYTNTKAFKKAEKYLQKALKSVEIPDPDFYHGLFTLYKTSGELDKAIENYEKYIMLNDSVLSVSKRMMIQNMEDSLRREGELKATQKLEYSILTLKRNKIIFIVSILIIVIVAGVIGRKWIIKQRATHRDLVITQEELSSTNKKLSSTTFHLLEKEGKISEVTNTLKKMSQNEADMLKPELKGLIKSLEKDYKNKDTKEQFRLLFEDANNGFFEKLLQQYENLTPQELKISALLRLNLSTKEIATLLDSSEYAVNKGRYRLRRKLELDRKTNLTKFLMTI